MIHGHTDSKGTKYRNQKLSEDRALSVLKYLLKKSNIPSSGFSYKGFADTRPVSSNATAEGRMKNRRVEIKILDD